MASNPPPQSELGGRIAPGMGPLYRWILPLFRQKRMRRFQSLFLLGASLSSRDREGAGPKPVLDVGGEPFNWSLLPNPPPVTVVNLTPPAIRTSGFTWIIADGRMLPFRDNAFPIVYSNSVIEHIGHPADQRRFAGEIARVGESYYVQTPNRDFFFEPHLLTPFFHWLPAAIQKRSLRWCTVLGWLTRPSPQECAQFVDGTRLLTGREMRALFPGARIERERFLGQTKSWIAIRLPISGEEQNER